VRAFIVRPFGVREGVDFERVERELIGPALERAGIGGRTTLEIAAAGNIRIDVFEGLLLADLVIADISIHNANVYYELGIRHALRNRVTILIRAKIADVPFDLKTDRYLEYETGAPASALPGLEEAIRQSLAAGKADSPVYQLLPNLEAQDPETFRPVPFEFVEAVERARAENARPMLALLGEEIEGLDWALSGRRLIGEAQFKLQAWSDARATYESIRRLRPDDVEASLKLGTVYERLREFSNAEEAVKRVLAQEQSKQFDGVRAEALALMGRNLKTAWVAEWSSQLADERAAAALRSARLYDSLRAYDDGFSENLNHHYSGINALALATVVVRLAEREPETWAARFESEEDGGAELARVNELRDVLATSVRRSLDAERYRRRQAGREDDVWLALSAADHCLLTSDRPSFVADAYRMASIRADAFALHAAARQLRMYASLGILAENASAALEALGETEEPPAEAPPTKSRVIVFSGHRIDAPGREPPRFPPDRAEEARGWIREAVQAELAIAAGRPIEGFAGGASGGDILFHEVCRELGILTTVLLALPPMLFAAKSVADAGPQWMERFNELREQLPTQTLSESEELPSWLARRSDYNIWQRNNLWTLLTGLARENADVTLIVLWDGKGGDGPGGTQDMVQIAASRGVKVVQLDAKRLATPVEV